MKATTMKPEIKARWIAALESGRYKHTKDKLKTSWGHCCLGVLAEECHEVLDEAGIEVQIDPALLSVNNVSSSLDKPSLNVFGLGKDIASQLVRINDAEETKDFSQQIEYIRRYVV